MQEEHNVEVTYRIEKDGSGVGVFLNDYPILLLPPNDFHEYTRLTVQADKELRKYEQESPVANLALGFSNN